MRVSKRFLFLLFPLVLALLGFSACSSQAAEKPLHILTNFPRVSIFTEEETKMNFLEYLEYAEGLNAENVEFEFLPEEDEELNARLTSLRTEIMAGGGPDVFIFFCNVPLGEEWASLSRNNAYFQLKPLKQLFPDVQKVMKNGVFRALEPYYETAKYFDPETIDPVILAAGQTDKGQMILPITFTIPTAIYEEGSASGAKAGANAFGITARNQFSTLFGQLADYQTEKLAFSREELLETVTTALSFKEDTKIEIPYNDWLSDKSLAPSPQPMDGLWYVQPLETARTAYWQPGRYFDFPETEKPQEIAPVRNRNGGVTAEITSYACINRNTKQPENAFKVLDFLFKTEVQSACGELPDERSTVVQTLFLCTCFGVPARRDLLQNYENSFGQNYVGQLCENTQYIASPETFEIYTNLRNEITTARFYGSLDEELQNMFNQCREADSDEEIEKLVSRTYETMTIMLGE